MKKYNFLSLKQFLALLSILLVSYVPSSFADNAEQFFTNNCLSCHTSVKPDFSKTDITERIERRGPLLYFAGDKFNKEWLQAWLEKPYRIRPGGNFPPDHTIVTDEGDKIDESTLTDHPSVPATMSAELTDYLMTLHLADKPTLETEYTPGTVTKMMGKMNFSKFKGCTACHHDEKDAGGFSGPELYTAWKRMQPEFIVSYIKDPVAWDPHTMMPNRHLKEADIHKLVDYLKLIGE